MARTPRRKVIKLKYPKNDFTTIKLSTTPDGFIRMSIKDQFSVSYLSVLEARDLAAYLEAFANHVLS